MSVPTIEGLDETTLEEMDREQLVANAYKVTQQQVMAELCKVRFASETLSWGDPIELPPPKLEVGLSRIPQTLEMIETSRPVSSTDTAERKSGMTEERVLNGDITREERAYEWMPEMIDDGQGDPYFLFTPEVHHKWMAKAEELARAWIHLEDHERWDVSRMLWLLMTSQEESYHPGHPDIGELDVHLHEQGDARSEDRYRLLFDKVRPIVHGEFILQRLHSEKPDGERGSLSDIWRREAAVRFAASDFRSEEADVVAERLRLSEVLGIANPGSPWWCVRPRAEP